MTTWTQTSDGSTSWINADGITIWDDGLTSWDTATQIIPTIWDGTRASTTYTAAPDGTTVWS